MRRLPIKAKRIIRKKKFSLNTIDPDNIAGWRRGLDIKWRITNVVSEHENWYEDQNPYNPKGNKILVNIKVSGNVESNEDLKEISQVARYTRVGGDKDGWGSYYNSNYYSGWGYDAHKRIRQEIRAKIANQLKNYLKLLGISSDRYWQKIEVNKITWEK
jgi:hypothetical protein